MPISPQALELCGEPRKPNQLVFEDLPDPSWISRPLKKWLETEGITKKITFHCFRHTFATLQLSSSYVCSVLCQKSISQKNYLI
jgi:integrase